VRWSDLLVTLTLTTGVAVAAAVTLDIPALLAETKQVTGRATCRTVDLAMLAYVAEYDRLPVEAADVQQYVRGDVSEYRIVNGRAAGPGCTPTPPR